MLWTIAVVALAQDGPDLLDPFAGDEPVFELARYDDFGDLTLGRTLGRLLRESWACTGGPCTRKADFGGLTGTYRAAVCNGVVGWASFSKPIAVGTPVEPVLAALRTWLELQQFTPLYETVRLAGSDRLLDDRTVRQQLAQQHGHTAGAIKQARLYRDGRGRLRLLYVVAEPGAAVREVGLLAVRERCK